jgi:hypothetical protein
LKSRQIPLRPPFAKGEKRKLLSKAFRKALLPLKKGGREGFRSPYFKKLNGYAFVTFPPFEKHSQFFRYSPFSKAATEFSPFKKGERGGLCGSLKICPPQH